jgi:hypothetical protein
MPNNDPSPSPAKDSGDVWLGGALVVLALIVVALSRSIKALGLGDNFDPGSKTFPLGLAAILGFGGLIEIWQSRRHPRAAPPTSDRSQSKTTLVLLAGLGVYIFLLPWTGFALSTLVMGTAMMGWLGNSWLRSVIASISLVGVVYALFVLGFKVPLPGGVLNLPF